MEFTDAWNEETPRLLSKADSFAILQSSDRGSYTSIAMTPPTGYKSTARRDHLPSDAISIDIALRRGRIAALTTVVVGTIVWLVLFFEKGYEIKWSDTEHLSSEKRKQVLDEYNSFTGNVASVFGKPIELFVAACVQVILLRFVSASMLRNEPSWKAVYSALGLSAAIGYLINNGFNSLNVQLVDSDITLAIESSDLARNDDVIVGLPDWKSRTTNVSHSVSEAQAQNPITNTVLRGLVLPRALRSKSACVAEAEQGSLSTQFPLDTVEFGFPQRDWMKQLLTTALPESALEFLFHPSDEDANNGVKGEELPMQASIAAQLVLYAIEMSDTYVPLDEISSDAPYHRRTEEFPLPEETPVPPAAIASSILPGNSSASDKEQKEWFVKNMSPVIFDAFEGRRILQLEDIPMRFSHIGIAPNIDFDAVTMEIDVAQSLLVEATDKQTGVRYVNSVSGLLDGANETRTFNCDPWPARCVFKKRDPNIGSNGNRSLHFDTPPQIQAFSICVHENGTEYLYPESCSKTSTTSILLISVGKRITVDELIQNATAGAGGVSPAKTNVATNMRKIYSFMVSRLSWNATDVATSFGATCNADTTTGKTCKGLVIGLQTPSGHERSQQHLIVGADSLPIDALMQLSLDDSNFTYDIQQPVTLVQVNEPPRQPKQEFWYDVLAGDILHPHNIGKLTWDLSRKTPSDMCEMEEERVQRVLDNHMYIEHPLQATYTAAVFFLLQNAVVKDTLVVNQRGTNFTTLAFDGNVQQVVLRVSIPSTNSLLTLLGCLLLVLGVAGSLVWATVVDRASHRQNLLSRITNAEVIARAKLDDKASPAFFLHRRISSANEKTTQAQDIDTLVITALSLSEPQRQANNTESECDTTNSVSISI